MNLDDLTGLKERLKAELKARNWSRRSSGDSEFTTYLRNPDGPEAAQAITDLEALVGELREALEQAVEWDSHDAEGVPAVWLGNASATLTKLEKARGKDQTDG